MNNDLLLQRRYRLLGEKAPLFYDDPLHIVKGYGVWLEDSDGKRYLDVYNNVPNVGHCHPKVVEALSKQAGVLNIHTRYLHETILEYGEKLTSKFDKSLSMLFLTCTGSEANEVALRMARTHTHKKGIICTNATYHGNTTAVDELATVFRGGQSTSPNVKPVTFPCSYRPKNGLSGEALADVYADEVKKAIKEFEVEGIGFAGMLICPIFLNEGLPNIPKGYMEKISRYVHDAGGILIFDEVQSAFGRSGNMWGYETAGVVPDIVTLGKPMGNGHPLAAAVCRSDLGNEFREKVMYFNTFGGNPVSCAVGLAVLNIIEEENLIENARQVGKYIKEGLDNLADQFDLIGDVRGKGLIFAVELVTDRESKKPAQEKTRQIVNLMKEQGVLISRIGMGDNILKMRPPICFSRDNADVLLTNLELVFSRLSN
jgi:4-aminobutyrate aminotransferase-like enzyme